MAIHCYTGDGYEEGSFARVDLAWTIRWPSLME